MHQRLRQSLDAILPPRTERDDRALGREKRAVASPGQRLAPVMTTTLLSKSLLVMMTPGCAVIQAR
jgi:hypothetical protein